MFRRIKDKWSAYRVIEDVYDRIAESDDVNALQLLGGTALDVVEELPAFHTLSIRYSLAKMFLEYKYADRMQSHRIFTRIRRSRYTSGEKALLNRYALLLIWHYRGGALTSPLVPMMHKQSYRRSKVRHSLLNKFGGEAERAV